MKHFNDKVKAKIVELVPELQTCQCVEYVQEHAFNGETIRLADVLLAIGESENVQRFSTNLYGTKLCLTYLDAEGYQNNQSWNLLHDYDGQSDEVKAFIGSLLGVTE